MENNVLYWLESIRTDSLTQVLGVVTHLGGTKSLIIIIGLTLLALILTKFYKEAVMLAGTMLVGVTVSQSLKHLINRPRPDVVSHLTEFSSPSFPSGHAMNNMLFATVITYLSWRVFKRKRWSVLIGVMMYVWAILVGFSRLYLGVHYPTDVLAGWALGLVVGLGAIWVAGRMDAG